MYLRKISSKAVKVPARAMTTTPQQSALIQQVTEAQKERANRVVPWFLNNMPVSKLIVCCIFSGCSRKK